MTKQRFGILMVVILMLVLGTVAKCQTPEQPDLYEKVFVSAGIDISKLSPEEQTKLKTLLGQAMVFSHGQGKIEGYKEGMEASKKITTELLDGYYLIRKGELEELIPAKPSKLQRIGAALTAFSQGYNAAAQAQRKTWITTNCSSSRFGTTCTSNW